MNRKFFTPTRCRSGIANGAEITLGSDSEEQVQKSSTWLWNPASLSGVLTSETGGSPRPARKGLIQKTLNPSPTELESPSQLPPQAGPSLASKANVTDGMNTCLSLNGLLQIQLV